MLKRGVWQYSPVDVGTVSLENGVELNIAERQKLIDEKTRLIKGRAKSMEYLDGAAKKATPAKGKETPKGKEAPKKK